MMASSKGPFCPECDRPATGNFCQHCGANLGGRFCNQCGTKVSAGAQFCNQCGAKTGTGGPGAHREAAAAFFSGQNLAWWLAGAAMFALIVVVGVSMVRPGPPPGPGSTPTTGGAQTATPSTGGTPPDISNMTPIEAADRLFDRVMRAVSAGDSAQAQAFLPMAIGAYQRARPLSHDGLFHLSMLNRTAGNFEAALAQAYEIIDEDPNHLLARAAAAEAAIELGELDEAEVHYRHVLEIYDQESQRDLEEYTSHALIVGAVSDDAERFLAGR